jgi:hypothetical protein
VKKRQNEIHPNFNISASKSNFGSAITGQPENQPMQIIGPFQETF